MKVHLDALGWLYVLVGWMGLLTGAAFLIIASGTAVTIAPLVEIWGDPVIWLLLLAGLTLTVGGWLMTLTGRAVVARRLYGRPAALALAMVNLGLLPFGTALSVYTLWTLLNDDARRVFGRRLRAPETS